MPGDRYWRKKLEGRELMQWYFPSKYNLQDFRVDDYFEMQAERFAPREAHECVPALDQMLEKVSDHREALRSFFNGLDEPTFLDSPALQDLYGLFRLVDADPALSFEPPPTVFLEHSPLFGKAPPLRAFASEEGHELYALFLHLKSRLGADAASALEARVARLRSPEDVRELLAEEAARLNATVPFEHLSVALEEEATAEASASSQRQRRPTATARPAASAAGAEDAKRPAKLGEEETPASAPEETPSRMAAEEEDPFAGLLGTWSYSDGQFEVSRSEDGQVWLAGELVKMPVSGLFEPDGAALLAELRPAVGGEALGSLRLQPGDAPGQALLSFRRAGRATWIQMPAHRLEPPRLPPALPAAAPAEAAAGAAAPEAGAAEEAKEDERAVPAKAAPGEAGGATEDAVLNPHLMETGRDHEDEDLDTDLLRGAGSEPPLAQAPAPRRRLQAYALRRTRAATAAEQKAAEAELQRLRAEGPQVMRKYLARRHRFIDPMYRRRRLKWIERTIVTERNKETEIKFNSYYSVHPDDQADWPTNKGSVTVVWPSPYH